MVFGVQNLAVIRAMKFGPVKLFPCCIFSFLVFHFYLFLIILGEESIEDLSLHANKENKEKRYKVSETFIVLIKE